MSTAWAATISALALSGKSNTCSPAVVAVSLRWIRFHGRGDFQVAQVRSIHGLIAAVSTSPRIVSVALLVPNIAGSFLTSASLSALISAIASSVVGTYSGWLAGYGASA